MREERLQKTIRELVDSQPNDERLRDNLEGLQKDESLPGLTWYWGSLLYTRNRAIFRSFILSNFSDWKTTRVGWKRIVWSDHDDELEAWLASARVNRDPVIVRRLLRWKYADKKWGIDLKRWNSALSQAYYAAEKPAARAVVLEEFDDWFQLDEDTALQLYSKDRASADFILKHLPQGSWSGDKRQLWNRLSVAARRAGDEKLELALYRKQQPIKQWTADILNLADSIQDPDSLNDELQRRHLEGYGLNLGAALIKLLEKRRRDVMPYVRAKLKESLGGWFGNPADPFVKLAKREGWWDLWAAAIRVAPNPKLFNKAVSQLLDDSSIDDRVRIERLQALAGVSREWNWPGFGLAQVHSLDDVIAAKLYHRFPQLVRGCFKPNVTPTWWQGFPELLAAAQGADDEDMVDVLASRYATQVRYDYAWNRKQRDQIMETADALGDYFQALRERDAIEFARRAANVLTRVPAFAIYNYNQLLKTNKLARLLFVRSFDALLAAPDAVCDLVEGSEIHVQMLAYRVLAQDDPRARALAVETLDILIGTLLRPLHRKTRLAAFQALANAARSDLDAASFVLRRAREAMRLPDKRYPKEELVGLIAQVLHAHAQLRGPNEQPVVYGIEEVLA